MEKYSESADLMMRTHVQRTVSRCFAALRQLRQIRQLVPRDTLQMLVVALVHSCLDYRNSTLAGIPGYLTRRLQSVLNAAARLKIYQLRSSDHITDALVCLHWLRIPDRSADLQSHKWYGTAIFGTICPCR